MNIIQTNNTNNNSSSIQLLKSPHNTTKLLLLPTSEEENKDPKMLISLLSKLGLQTNNNNNNTSTTIISTSTSSSTPTLLPTPPIIEQNNTTQQPLRKSLGSLPSRVSIHNNKPLLNNRYRSEKCLGTGNFAKVILATDTTLLTNNNNSSSSSSNDSINEHDYQKLIHNTPKLTVAIKAIELDKVTDRVRLEIEMLRKLQHSPFVVKLHETFQTPKYLCLVMDFLAGGELYAVLDRKGGYLSRNVTQFVSGEILLGLEALHSNRIAYRDLKPENVMFNTLGHVVLVDLGLSKSNVTALCGSTSLVGTPEYLAPEVLLKREHGFSVDFWSLGMIIHELVMGLPPWFDSDPTEMMRRVVTEPLQINKCSNRIDKPFVEIVTRLLMKEPGMRLGVLGGHAEIKRSSFFTEMNWKLLDKQQMESPLMPELNGPYDVSYFSKSFLCMSGDLS
jgi:serum/glucocorticoid-regulated kinase 2